MQSLIKISFRDDCQNMLLTLSKFKQINYHLLPLKSTENQRFSEGIDVNYFA